MSKYIRPMLKVVVAAALVGVTTACNTPLRSQNQNANQVGRSSGAAQDQSNAGVPIQRANQPATQGQNSNSTTAQAPDGTTDPLGDPAGVAQSDTSQVDTAPSDSNQPVSALW